MDPQDVHNQQLLLGNNYRLYFESNQNQILLKLQQINGNQYEKQYRIKIMEKNKQNQNFSFTFPLSKYFTCFNQLRDYVKYSEAVHVNIDDGTLNIQINNHAKSRQISENLKLKMQSIATCPQDIRKKLQEVIKVCNTKEELKNMDIKENLKIICNVIQDLINVGQKSDHKQDRQSKNQVQRQNCIHDQLQSVRNEISKIIEKAEQQNRAALQIYKNQLKQFLHLTLNNIKPELGEQIDKNVAKNQDKEEYPVLSGLLTKYHQNKLNKDENRELHKKIQKFQRILKDSLAQYSEKQRVAVKELQKITKVLKEAYSQDITYIAVNSREWVDPGCFSIKKLTLLNDTIIGKETDGVRVFGKKPIKGVYKYGVKINLMKNHMQIGVADCQLGHRQGVYGTNIVYYGNDAEACWGKDKKYQGKGFKQSETVLVSIDLINGSCEWKVGSNVRHCLYFSLLKDAKINWVPYLYFGNTADSVSIFQVIAE